MNRADIVGRRDRMAGVLQPLLGVRCAQERASDIVQVLLFGEQGVAEVAARILARHLGREQAEQVAARLSRAWLGPVLVHSSRAPRPAVRAVRTRRGRRPARGLQLAAR